EIYTLSLHDALPISVAEKAGAVGLIFHLAYGFSFGNYHVHHPDLGLAMRSWPSRGEQSAQIGDIFGLHKQIGKSRVSRICCWRRQDDFGVRCQLDLPGSCAEIRNRDPAYFRVVRRRDYDFKRGPDCAIAAPELDVILGKSDFIAIGLGTAWLVCSRPDLAAGSVAQEKIRPPAVPRAVFAPTCNGKVMPVTIPGARGGDHHRVSAVGKKVDAGIRVVRRVEATHHRMNKI